MKKKIRSLLTTAEAQVLQKQREGDSAVWEYVKRSEVRPDPVVVQCFTGFLVGANTAAWSLDKQRDSQGGLCTGHEAGASGGCWAVHLHTGISDIGPGSSGCRYV